MRRYLPIVLALAALAAPAAAHAAAADVNIGDSPVYSPATVTISPGDSVIWHRTQLLPSHGVQFDDETGTTATCQPTGVQGTTCTRAFPNPGRLFYMDPATCTSGPASACSVHGEVIVYVPPTASFTATPTTLLRGQTVNFDGTASKSPGGQITGYTWDFGDGTTGTGATNFHTYTTAGTYTAKLTVTDDQRNVAVATQTIQVNVPDTDGDGFNDDHDACPLIPGVFPDGCPPVPPPPPIATAAVSATQIGLAGALKSGVNVVVTCSAACVAELAVFPPSLAAQIPAALASATVSIPQGGSQVVTLQFSAPAKQAIAKLKKPTLKLLVTVTDALGRVQTRTSTIVLKTVKKFGTLPAIGISDENAATFADPLFQVLKLKFARLVTPWNSIFTEPARLDAWLQAARLSGARPLVSFEHQRGDLCPQKPCHKAPSIGKYRHAWLAFHRKYPWVKDVSPWNEVNSSTQPTGRRPDLAAAYYNVVRASCRGCNIVAADVLDLNNLRRYLIAFMAKAKGKPRLWGLHNYRDTNRFRQTGTRQLLATVKGQVWFTETGGIVKFTTQGGKKALPTSETRARKAMEYMFKLAEIDSKRVKRIYVYQWKVNFAGDRFDAGVVRPDGTPRPSFDVLTLNASIARKR